MSNAAPSPSTIVRLPSVFGPGQVAWEGATGAIAAFEGHDYVVLPSGSCAGTMVHAYPELLAGDPEWAARLTDPATGPLKTYRVQVDGVPDAADAADAPLGAVYSILRIL